MNTAKHLPPKTSRVLERERLLNRLLSWEDKKLVIIHAQAGQGKSTLAAGFVHMLSAPAVWYNLDQEDDNPLLFLSSLAKAVQRAWPDRVAGLSPLPRNCFDGNRIHQGLDRWIGQVFGNLPPACLIVFDDYNSTSSSLLQHLLTMLIEGSPPHIRFLVLSRVRPELGIAKLRATQSVGELTGEDLRFSDTEVQDLFSMVFHMQISQNEAALVNSTAEGWPAGLVLMHEYLAALPPDARPVAIADRRAAGFRTHVFDYLAQEVFIHLSPDMQRFLLRTSIVDYLSIPLMELLTGLPGTSRKDSVTTMVRELRNRNLFVHAMADDASVIRYHALFREFLRKKLIAQTRPRELKNLYTAAANHFKRNGDEVRSIDLLLASGQFDRAVRQIEFCGEELIAGGQIRTLIRWIETLPLEFGNRPWFLFYRGVSCRFTDPRTALIFYDLAFKGFHGPTASHDATSGPMLSLSGIIEACFLAGGNFKRMARAALTAKSLLGLTKQKSPKARARLLLALGTACFFLGRLQQGTGALREALESFRQTRDYYYQIQSAIYLAPCSIYLGDFRLAREAVRKGFEAHRAIPDESGGEAALHMAKGMTALFQGNFSEAQESIDRCHSLAQEYELEAFDYLTLDIGGWLKIALAEYADAEQLLRQCKRKGEELVNPFFNTSAAHLLAVNYLHQNRLEQAQAEAAYALAIRSRSGSRLFYAVSLSASGALDLKCGRLAKAERELLQSLAVFRRKCAAQQEANVLLLLAKLSRLKNREQDVNRFLQAGFGIGEKRGFRYYYLLSREEVANLARHALAHGICTDYCRTLLSGRIDGTETPAIKIYCLGGFRVFRGREQVSDGQWKSARAKSFLKLLATRDNLSMSRETALDMLWQDDQPDTPGRAFNSMIYRIRRVLEPSRMDDGSDSCILQKDGAIFLDRDRVWTDVRQFNSYADAAERMRSVGQPAKALETYGKAVALYQGDFLSDDLSPDWAVSTRDQLRVRFLRALEEGAAIAASAGDRAQALNFYEKLFLADPCNEKACCWLMMRYRSDGQRGEAIRTYERCERALSRELDLEPEEETRKVYRSIIGG